MTALKWQTFEAFGRKLIAVPVWPGEPIHKACQRCLRTNDDAGGSRCMDLPACSGVYFQFADKLTPEDSARLALHKLEGEP